MKRYFLVLFVPAVCLGTIDFDIDLRHNNRADANTFHEIYSAAPLCSGSCARTLCFGVPAQCFSNSATFKVWHLGTFTRSLVLRLTGGSQGYGDDYYHILGVDKNCNEDEIRKAYRYSNVRYRSGASFLPDFT